MRDRQLRSWLHSLQDSSADYGSVSSLPIPATVRSCVAELREGCGESLIHGRSVRTLTGFRAFAAFEVLTPHMRSCEVVDLEQ